VRDRSARDAELAHERVTREEQRARERAERLAKVAGQLDLILAEVERLEAEQRWPEALAAARRAEAALALGEVEPSVHERIRKMLADLEMVARLEDIRLSRSERDPSSARWTFDDTGSARRYAAAFRDY